MKELVRIFSISWALALVGLSEEIPALVILDSGISSSLVSEEGGELKGAFISEKRSNLQKEAAWVSANLVDPEAPPEDQIGHGTHLSGLLWAEQKALRDDPKPCLVMLKVGDEKFAAEKLVQGLTKVAEMKQKGLAVKLVLCAFHLEREDCSPEEFAAFEATLTKLLDEGVVVVAAAGNRGQDLDVIDTRERGLPAGFEHENLVVVAAASEAGLLTSRTNFGKESVWIAAEGVQVESLGIDGNRKKLSGSSQAAAIVAGQLFHRLLSAPEGDFEVVKKEMEQGAKRHPSLTLSTQSGRFLGRTRAE